MISIMRSVRRMKAVFFARNLEYLRDRKVWNLVFPVLIVFALAVVFSGPPRPLFTVTAVASDSLPELLEFPGIEIISADRSKALDRLSRQQTDLVVEVVEDSVRYWGERKFCLGCDFGASSNILNQDHSSVAKLTVKRFDMDWGCTRYFGMNMMYSALWGVGYVVVRYRQEQGT